MQTQSSAHVLGIREPIKGTPISLMPKELDHLSGFCELSDHQRFQYSVVNYQHISVKRCNRVKNERRFGMRSKIIFITEDST